MSANSSEQSAAKMAASVAGRIIATFPEVVSVHGKIGRADTATAASKLDARLAKLRHGH